MMTEIYNNYVYINIHMRRILAILSGVIRGQAVLVREDPSEDWSKNNSHN